MTQVEAAICIEGSFPAIEAQTSIQFAIHAMAACQSEVAIGAELDVFLQDQVDNASGSLGIEGCSRLVDHFDLFDVCSGHFPQQTLQVHVPGRLPVYQDGDIGLPGKTHLVTHHQQAWHFAQQFYGRAGLAGNAFGYIYHHLSGLLFEKGLAGCDGRSAKFGSVGAQTDWLKSQRILQGKGLREKVFIAQHHDLQQVIALFCPKFEMPC